MSKDNNQSETEVKEQKLDHGYSASGDTRGKADNVNPVQDNEKVTLNAPGADFGELKNSEAALKDNMPLDNTPAGKAAGNDDGRDMTQDEPHIKDQVDLNSTKEPNNN